MEYRAYTLILHFTQASPKSFYSAIDMVNLDYETDEADDESEWSSDDDSVYTDQSDEEIDPYFGNDYPCNNPVEPTQMTNSDITPTTACTVPKIPQNKDGPEIDYVTRTVFVTAWMYDAIMIILLSHTLLPTQLIALVSWTCTFYFLPSRVDYDKTNGKIKYMHTPIYSNRS